MEKKKLSITCPLCGRKDEFPLENLQEGSTIQCPFCKMRLNLHGHMWEEIQADIRKLNSGRD